MDRNEEMQKSVEKAQGELEYVVMLMDHKSVTDVVKVAVRKEVAEVANANFEIASATKGQETTTKAEKPKADPDQEEIPITDPKGKPKPKTGTRHIPSEQN